MTSQRWLLQLDFSTTFLPYVHSVIAPDYQSFEFALAGGSDWTPLPIEKLETVKGIVFEVTPVPIEVRIYGQIDANVEAGFFALWDTELSMKTVTNPLLLVRNTGENPATIVGIAVGIGFEDTTDKEI